MMIVPQRRPTQRASSWLGSLPCVGRERARKSPAEPGRTSLFLPWLVALARRERAERGRERARKNRRSAFTLLELVLVIALLVILAAIAVPPMERMYGDMKLDAAADQIRARWADARSRAMEEGNPYRFAIMPGEGRFRLAPELPTYWNGGGGNALMMGGVSENGTTRPPLVIEESLPEDIRFAYADLSAMTPDGWVPVASFLPDGTAREDVVIEISSEGFRPVVLRLRGLTGSVTVTRPSLQEGASAP